MILVLQVRLKGINGCLYRTVRIRSLVGSDHRRHVQQRTHVISVHAAGHLVGLECILWTLEILQQNTEVVGDQTCVPLSPIIPRAIAVVGRALCQHSRKAFPEGLVIGYQRGNVQGRGVFRAKKHQAIWNGNEAVACPEVRHGKCRDLVLHVGIGLHPLTQQSGDADFR